MNEQKKISFLGLFSIILVIILMFESYYFLFLKNTECSDYSDLETQICETGSILEIPVDQTYDETSYWNIYSNNEHGFKLKYPKGFFDIGHEVKAIIGDCNYQAFPDVCPDISNIITDLPSTDNGLIINEKTLNINNIPYCLYNYKDAAMGHVYNYDYYTTVKNNKCFIIPIITSKTNCDLYLPIEASNSEQQNNYENCIIDNDNQPKLLKKIIGTFEFVK